MNLESDISARVSLQRQFFQSDSTRTYEFRLAQLESLGAAIRKHQDGIIDALSKDLGKSPGESYLSEVAILFDEIQFAKKNLKKWMARTRVATPFTLAVASSYTLDEPLGVSLIIAPWNYPFQLAIAPLIGAICAGNTAVVKPSELASATSSVIVKLIAEAFDPQYIWTVEGGVEVSTALLQQRWDHIFFTGSTAVGKIVMQAAARNLTPVTLELGGKSPCILDRDADLEVAIKRITWGKFFNAGQTCVAPDYLFIPKGTQEMVVDKIKKNVENFYSHHPRLSGEFTRIISDKHFERLKSLISYGKVVLGGDTQDEGRYFSPTVVVQPDLESPLMREEIFGPILPVIEYECIDEVINFIRKRESPLALYYFGRSKEVQRRIVSELSFGGACINDTLLHLSNPYLPFGGVGASGMGSYHGYSSFKAFSNCKGVLVRATWFDLSLRYPPYAPKLKWLKWMFR